MPLGLDQNLTEKDYQGLLTALDKTALVSMTDNKGNILYANNKFIEVSKYSLPELFGQNHRILKSHQQPDEVFVDLWKTISSGQVWRGEIKNRAKDSTYYWVDTSIAPILGSDGKPERYISVRFLITDKKNVEEAEKKRSEEIEKMNKFMIDRELKMVELKREIDNSKKQPPF
ncbi:MAG: hypothetical protein A3B23_02250 [Candidatus Colwellbacteria bacterium RIFCSPLOWO2_01_FULL_48_10]|uniref:PAC domain-containing protein n=2 Tax=Bacteria candidate phyla TaxID=1783234 RepID=A0A1F5P412_9BACT|nr:MAG: hypothetical protein A2846_03645 [Candidatus Doudnabacteria bacterium RIFCSPHIGHO2_01_FULL_49_9]OGY59948.1 MAG: hypothetical protein A3B23_02250 [Candidatus Colwellbacteria bacterium RIFCSPLOWO2_01_FULL_48_10]